MLPKPRIVAALALLLTLLGCARDGVVAQNESAASSRPDPVVAPAPAGKPSALLAEYVARPDNNYEYHIRASGRVGAATFVELIMTSQVWHDITWRHQLFIIKPSNINPANKQALLYIAGGNWKDELGGPASASKLPSGSDAFAQLAEVLGTPVVILRQVPFQPIFNGLTEDRAIAESFQRYLDTGDSTWPLLAPMVKSAVRAMDTVQKYTRDEWQLDVRTFTVTGASKRGWTTWLTGAVDARVTAMAPIVIDLLDLPRQMALARASFGGSPSQKISAYTERNMDEKLGTDAGRELLKIVDPYSYRAVLNQPKLIINGTNDPYWPLEALNLYWNDLGGEKYVLYVPNAGHGVNDYVRLMGSLAAFHRHAAQGMPLPKMNWSYAEELRGVRLTLSSDMAPTQALAWVAQSPTRDFREAVWRSTPMQRTATGFEFVLEKPAAGYAAVLGEGTYPTDYQLPFYLSTQVRVIGADSTAKAAAAAPAAE
jgi:PhoPQ-activated pathogenicity-related protein